MDNYCKLLRSCIILEKFLRQDSPIVRTNFQNKFMKSNYMKRERYVERIIEKYDAYSHDLNWIACIIIAVMLNNDMRIDRTEIQNAFMKKNVYERQKDVQKMIKSIWKS